MNFDKKYKEIFLPMRLQPPHIGHIQIIKKAYEISNKITILITNEKELNFKNPLYDFEKEAMLIKSLKDLDLELNKINIKQIPSKLDKKDWFDFILRENIIDKDTVVLSGNPFIIDMFPKKIGTKIILTPKEILGEEFKEIDATQIRNMIINEDDKWMGFAASGTVFYFEKFNLKERLIKLKEESF